MEVMNLEQKIYNIILLTGPPGVGKTTLLRKICDEVRVTYSCQGFLTEEVRDEQSRKRIGFDAVTMCGQRCVLARNCAKKNKHMTMVGKYYIYIDDFENLVLPLISCANSKFQLLVIDEIGKMELKSKKFESALYELIQKVPILATIPYTLIKQSNLVEYIKKTPRSMIYEINQNNRDVIQKHIVTSINIMLKNN